MVKAAITQLFLSVRVVEAANAVSGAMIRGDCQSGADTRLRLRGADWLDPCSE